MTTDREMLSPQGRNQHKLILEFAAKALDLRGCKYAKNSCGHGIHHSDGIFNSLTNSADCAAMCAKLRIDTLWCYDMVECQSDPVGNDAFASIYSQFDNDPEAAWRFAATMVAAKIGGMK